MSARGFTLIEVLLALTALSVIMSVVYITLSSSIGAIERAESSVRSLQEARALLDNLRREIESSLYNPTNEKAFFRFMEKDMYGRPASDIAFTGLSNSSWGLFVVAYKTEEVRGKLVIYKKIHPVGSAQDGDEWDVLIEDVHSFSVQAYGGGELVKSWDSKLNQTVPEEVRISIALKARGDETLQLTDFARIRINRAL